MEDGFGLGVDRSLPPVALPLVLVWCAFRSSMLSSRSEEDGITEQTKRRRRRKHSPNVKSKEVSLSCSVCPLVTRARFSLQCDGVQQSNRVQEPTKRANNATRQPTTKEQQGKENKKRRQHEQEERRHREMGAERRCRWET